MYGLSAVFEVSSSPSTNPSVPAAISDVAVVPEPRTTDSLRVSWTVPDNTGKPALTGYDLRYKRDARDAEWVLVSHARTETFGTLTGLDQDTDYFVEVRALNAEYSGPWSSTAEGATSPEPETVLANHPLVPDDLGPGDSFRLLHVTSDTTAATGTGIHHYDSSVTFDVLSILNTGNLLYQWPEAALLWQRALVSTAGADARLHTDTTWTESDRGVPIYWVNGARVADDYEDFYDGSWDDEANPMNGFGKPRSLAGTAPWTGTSHDGTELFEGGVSRAVGQAMVGVGAPDSAVSGAGPLNGGSTFASTEERPLYALWHVMVIDENFRLAGNLNSAIRGSESSDERASVRAQLFTTGPNPGGYGISEIVVRKVSADPADASLGDVALYTTDASGDPDLADGLHATLSLESTDSTFWFLAAPEGTVLETSTTYALVFEGKAGAYPKLATSSADGEDAVAEGWSLADVLRYHDGSNWVDNPDGYALQMDIIGPLRDDTAAVPADWSLKPADLDAGDEFRLLFLSSTKRNALSTDIADYNTFVQDRAAVGHADIQAYSGGFGAVGCTTAVDARDNTSTTGTGVPIYWLNGAKVADDYADFYDGSWDDEANNKNETGNDGPDTSQQANYPWTGCNDDGTEVTGIMSGLMFSRALGTPSFDVRFGRPNSTGSGHGPIDGSNVAARTETRPMYGLSEVFQVGAANTPAAGVPVVTAPNVFRVPAVLGVDLSGITDVDGVTSIATNATYKWQRFNSTGVNLDTDNIGTGSTYTLTDTDAGKTLKVVVNFTDDASNSEGPLTSAATSAITAAASCTTPTYLGGATQVWTAKVGVGKNNDFYGYYDSPTLAFGSLDGDRFSISSNNYQVDRVFTQPGPSLAFSMKSDFTSDEQKTLALHICDQAFAFSVAGAPSSGSTYAFNATDFPDADLDWSPHAERTIYLSQDTAGPTLISATATGTTLVMTFSEPLGAAANLANGDFSGKKTPSGGSQTALTLSATAPAISGSTVTLTLATASAVVVTDTNVLVSYTKPSSGTANKLVDAFGNETANFTDQPVGNLLADSTPPELANANTAVLAADGLTLTLTYNEALRTTSVPVKDVFTVNATPLGGSEETIDLAATSGVSVTGSTVVLKLARPIAHNDGSVKVTYSKPGMGAVIEDANGNDAAGFTDQEVTNNSTVPRVSIEAVYTDATPGIAPPTYRVTRSLAGSAPLTVNITVTQADNYIDAGTYFTPGNSPLRIAANQATVDREVNTEYTGNTSGNLTFTVAGGDDHLPALAPKDSASVQIKVPTSGPPARVSQPRAYSVKEGDVLNAALIATTGAGVAEPRASFTVAIYTEAGTATINVDYDHISRNVAFPVSGWTATGDGAYTQTPPAPIQIPDDDEHEADETFTIVLQNTPGVSQAITINYTPVTVTITDDDALDVTGGVGDLDAGGSERVLPGGGDHQLHGCHQRRGDGHGHAAVHLRAGRPDPPGGVCQRLGHQGVGVHLHGGQRGRRPRRHLLVGRRAGPERRRDQVHARGTSPADRRPAGARRAGSPGGPQGGRDEADPGVGQAEPDHDDADLQRGAEPHRSGSLGLHGKGQRRRRRRPNGGVRERPRRDPHAGDGGAPRSNGDGELRAAGHEQAPGPERKGGRRLHGRERRKRGVHAGLHRLLSRVVLGPGVLRPDRRELGLGLPEVRPGL